MQRLRIDRFLGAAQPDKLAQTIAAGASLSADQVLEFAKYLAKDDAQNNAFSSLTQAIRRPAPPPPQLGEEHKDDEQFIRQAEHTARQRKRASTAGSMIAKRTAKPRPQARLFDLRNEERLVGVDPYWQNNPDFVYIGRYVQHHTHIGELKETQWSIPARFFDELSSLDRVKRLYAEYAADFANDAALDALAGKFLVCNCGHVYDDESTCHGHLLLSLLDEKLKQQ